MLSFQTLLTLGSAGGDWGVTVLSGFPLLLFLSCTILPCFRAGLPWAAVLQENIHSTVGSPQASVPVRKHLLHHGAAGNIYSSVEHLLIWPWCSLWHFPLFFPPCFSLCPVLSILSQTCFPREITNFTNRFTCVLQLSVMEPAVSSSPWPLPPESTQPDPHYQNLTTYT